MSGYLAGLEAESIEIIREAIALAHKPLMMYSIGKDSSVMLHWPERRSGRQCPRFRFFMSIPPGSSAR